MLLKLAKLFVEDIEQVRSEEIERLRSLTAAVISSLIAEILLDNLSNILCDGFEWCGNSLVFMASEVYFGCCVRTRPSIKKTVCFLRFLLILRSWWVVVVERNNEEDRKEKKELYYRTSKTFQSKKRTKKQQKEWKNGIGRAETSTWDRKKQNRHRRSIIMKVRKRENGQRAITNECLASTCRNMLNQPTSTILLVLSFYRRSSIG